MENPQLSIEKFTKFIATENQMKSQWPAKKDYSNCESIKNIQMYK